MKFHTKYNRPESDSEKNSGELCVELAGYIPMKDQIESYFVAGQKLQDSRAQQYDFQDDKSIDDDFLPVSRNPNVDIVDVTREGDALVQKYDEVAENAKKVQNYEKEQKEVKNKKDQEELKNYRKNEKKLDKD